MKTTLLRAVTYMGHNDCHSQEPFLCAHELGVHHEEQSSKLLKKTGQVHVDYLPVGLTWTGLWSTSGGK